MLMSGMGDGIGNGVRGQARAHLRRVGSQRDGSAEQHRGDACFGAEMTGGLRRKKCRAQRADEGVKAIPDWSEERDLVGDKFGCIHEARNGEYPGVSQRMQFVRHAAQPPEANRKANRQDGGIEIDAGADG